MTRKPVADTSVWQNRGATCKHCALQLQNEPYALMSGSCENPGCDRCYYGTYARLCKTCSSDRNDCWVCGRHVTEALNRAPTFVAFAAEGPY